MNLSLNLNKVIKNLLSYDTQLEINHSHTPAPR